MVFCIMMWRSILFDHKIANILRDIKGLKMNLRDQSGKFVLSVILGVVLAAVIVGVYIMKNPIPKIPEGYDKSNMKIEMSREARTAPPSEAIVEATAEAATGQAETMVEDEAEAATGEGEAMMEEAMEEGEAMMEEAMEEAEPASDEMAEGT